MTDMKPFFKAISVQNRTIPIFPKPNIAAESAIRLLAQQAKDREEEQQKLDKIIRRLFK